MADPSFHIHQTLDVDLGRTLVVGVADIGVAGLTAVDYLTTHSGVEQVGHVTTRNFPDITPFTDGTPRYPMRLYSDSTGMSVFISEIFPPVGAADPLADAFLEWIETTSLTEIVFLYGAPFPHAEEEHTVFTVATQSFQDTRLAETTLTPLPGGYFDGVVAEFLARGINDPAPSVGALVTPAHFPGPDFEGAIRLVEGFASLYGVDVDVTELRTQSEELRRYYQGISQRMESFREGDQAGGAGDYPEDRMYM